MMQQQRVAILGLGKIGSILLQGLLKAGLPPGNVRATVRHDDTPAVRGMLARVPYAVRVEEDRDA